MIMEEIQAYTTQSETCQVNLGIGMKVIVSDETSTGLMLGQASSSSPLYMVDPNPPTIAPAAHCHYAFIFRSQLR